MAAKEPLLAFDALWPLLLRHSAVTGVETIDIAEGAGRILAEPPRALWNMPRFDASAMDGYAVRHSDCQLAQPASAITLVLDTATDAYAGAASGALRAGFCISIGTGGRVPPGADCIIPKEDCRRTPTGIVIERAPKAGQHIRKQGEEFAVGDTLGAKGDKLDGFALALLRSAGVQTLHVYRPLRVMVVTTGNEIVATPGLAGASQIVDTNGPMLEQLLRDDCGVQAGVLGPVADDPAQLAAVLQSAIAQSDLVILTGGVSVGDRDYVKPVLEQTLGVARVVWGVAVKPGKPLYAGMLGATMVIGLPGNPGAVAAAWTTTVRPLVQHLQGRRNDPRAGMSVCMDARVKREAGKTRLMWCTLEMRGGMPWAVPASYTASHMLRGIAGADGIVALPPVEMPMPDRVPFWPR